MFTKIKFGIVCSLIIVLSTTGAFAQDDDKSPQQMMQDAVQAQQSGDHEGAIKILLKLEEQFPQNAGVIGQLGINYHLAENYEKAIEYHRKLAQSDNAQAKANGLYNLACAYSLTKETDKAFENLKKAVVAGYSDISHMRQDSDFDNIKEDERFEEMIEWIKAGGKEPKKLKAEDFYGAWKIESGMRAGSKIDSGRLPSIKITKESFTIPSPEGEFVMAYKLNLKAKPIEIDFDIKSGPNPEGKAKGIIKMDGDKMVLCYHPEGEKRPEKFVCTEDNGFFMFKMMKSEQKTEAKAAKSKLGKALLGKWKCTKGTRAGENIGAERMDSIITFEDRMITIPVGEDQAFKMSYTIDADASPATIDMKIEEGPAPEGNALGIIKVDGDTCMLCYDPNGLNRPDKFESTASDGRFLFEMERQK